MFICCKCGKEGAHPMILSTSDFGKYQKGDYFCCQECLKEWDILWQKRGELPLVNVHKVWLKLFFETFLNKKSYNKTFNPSKRTSRIV